MPAFLLDTNIVNYLIRSHDKVLRRAAHVPGALMRISAITLGEIEHGLARRPQAVALRQAVSLMLESVRVEPWDAVAARTYGELRARMEREGRTLAPLDTQIAAHAPALDLVLVSNDAAFRHVAGLQLEDWCV